MSWTNVVKLVPRSGAPPAVSVCIHRRTKGLPRLSIAFNKAIAYQLGLETGRRAEVEVGDGEHRGMVRIVFDKPRGGMCVLSSGGRGAQGCRILVRVWSGLKDHAERVTLAADAFHWDAENRIAYIALPSSFLKQPVFQNALPTVCEKKAVYTGLLKKTAEPKRETT